MESMSSPSSSPPWSSTLSLYHLDEGNTHLINQQYKTSIESYTNCIHSTSTSPSPTSDDETSNTTNNNNSNDNNAHQREFITFRAYSHRAESYLQLNDHTNAKNDILKSHSVILSSSYKKNETNDYEIGMSFIRLGKAQFELKEYKSSLESFDRAAKELMISIDDTCKSSRCGNKEVGDADDESDDDGKLVMKDIIEEYRKQCEKELEKLPVTIGDIPSTKAKSTATTTATTETSDTTTTNTKPPTCPKYQYYQNDAYMTVAILEPNLDSTNVKVEFSLDELTVIVQKGGKNFTVICGTLFSATIVSKCKVKYMSEKVLIKLKKMHKHDWNTLFGGGAHDEDKEEERQRLQGESDIAAAAASASAAATGEGNDNNPTPTSTSKNTPYASSRDWDTIEKNLKREEEDEKPEGEGAFNKFLQTMFKDADEDTRRAMIKSYQTSGGTHLSCNWNEVSKTDYEKKRTAPKGQEWKNWEGKKLPMKDDD